MTEKYISIELTNKEEFPYSVVIKNSLICKIEKEYNQARYFEVGGILLGRISLDRKTIFIDNAETVKSKKIYSLAYIRNGKKAQKLINYILRATEGEMNYLGEWHTHPGIAPIPSFRDRNTIIELTKEKDSNYFSFTILLIMGRNKKMTITISSKKGIIECIHIH